VNVAPLILSVEVALIATAIATVAGVLTAVALADKRVPGRDFVDAMVAAPMVLPPTVLGYYLLTVVGRRSMVGALFERLTGSPIVFTRGAAVLAATLAALPFVVKAARAAIEEVDPRLVAAAETLGASRVRVLGTVVLPLAARGIAAGVTLGFARALGDFGVTLMIAGNLEGVTRTASLFIYDAVEADRGADAGAMAAVLTAIAVGFLYAVNKLSRRARRA
jgi:molybdate transport system permease protein